MRLYSQFLPQFFIFHVVIKNKMSIRPYHNTSFISVHMYLLTMDYVNVS